MYHCSCNLLIATMFCCSNESFDFVGRCVSHQFVFSGSAHFGLRTSCCVLWCWWNCSKTRGFDLGYGYGYPKNQVSISQKHGFSDFFRCSVSPKEHRVSISPPQKTRFPWLFFMGTTNCRDPQAADPGGHRSLQGEPRATLERTDAWQLETDALRSLRMWRIPGGAFLPVSNGLEIH